MSIAGKRGMLALRPARMGFEFGALLDRPNLPALPQRFGHVLAQPPGGFGMLGNDKVSNCVCAGGVHEVMVHHIATQRPIPPFSTPTALREYSKMLVAQGGLAYDAADRKTDTGLDPLQVAMFRQRTGITDDAGGVHKVRAFAGVRDLNDAMYATWFMGVAGLGLMLPNSAEKQFSAGHIWDDLRSAPQPSNGHYIVLVDRRRDGNLVVLTWGRLHAATPEYIMRYWAGAIAYLSEEYMLASGVSPEGFKLEVLANYLKDIS
jgi:hypothetical protein